VKSLGNYIIIEGDLVSTIRTTIQARFKWTKNKN